jgi:hypothetical protein
MKSLLILLSLCGFKAASRAAHAFHLPGSTSRTSWTETDSLSRADFMNKWVVAPVTFAVVSSIGAEPASARGRPTLERAFERYLPRIQSGREFYANDLRQIIAKSDWTALKLAVAEPPSRQKEDLQKPDSGVSERARLAGVVSEARFLTAADLLAGAFSDNSISTKTKKMQAAVSKLRSVVEELQSIAKQGLGEEAIGGLFGIGAKKANPAELAKSARQLYVAGGNALNEYIAATNEALPLQFERLDFIK